MTNGDLRGLRAYLMVVGACSKVAADGWTTGHDSMVWARLFDTHLDVTAQSARTAAWRTLRRLEDRGLLVCDRRRGWHCPGPGHGDAVGESVGRPPGTRLATRLERFSQRNTA
ncbi:hypothetical protein ACFXAE_30215 [Streptomyces sp. NPDC059454]|uniref:hypothetical protein n=1 Tax=Streptomyces sp. NPDC059454 TaxID=3346836 RepID=UPI003689C451